jgi:hypothetical protein
VCADRHSIFFQTKDRDLSLEEQLEGTRTPTQFGRLLDELGVQLILALSPQAKGRIERLWGTFQDRLTSELRLANACIREDAQRVLAGFLPRHNRRFAVAAKGPDPAWLKGPTEGRLRDIFCFKYRRVVANDNTVRFGKLALDLPATAIKHTYAHARVQVHEEFDGWVSVHYQGACLIRKLLLEPAGSHRVLPHSLTREQPPPTRVARPDDSMAAGEPRPPWRPPKTHPWKTGFKTDFRLSGGGR